MCHFTYYQGFIENRYVPYRGRVGPSTPFETFIFALESRLSKHLPLRYSIVFLKRNWPFQGKTRPTCDVLNFELVTVYCSSVSGIDHFRHQIRRCTSIQITWYKFPSLSLFYSALRASFGKLSEENLLPVWGQRVFCNPLAEGISVPGRMACG